MNIFEFSKVVLQLCPVPTCIQDQIYNLLVGYGTPCMNTINTTIIAFHKLMERVAIFNLTDSPSLWKYVKMYHDYRILRYNILYGDSSILTYYTPNVYFSSEAICELHLCHLNNSNPTPLQISKKRGLTSKLQDMMRFRLCKMYNDEPYAR